MRLDEAAIGKQLALAMNRASTRCVPLARGHLQVVAAVEREDRLDESFAEAGRANDERAIVVLERAGDDLRRRCRRSVDEDDEWNLRADVGAVRACNLGRRVASANAHDLLPFVEEQSTH